MGPWRRMFKFTHTTHLLTCWFWRSQTSAWTTLSLCSEVFSKLLSCSLAFASALSEPVQVQALLPGFANCSVYWGKGTEETDTWSRCLMCLGSWDQGGGRVQEASHPGFCRVEVCFLVPLSQALCIMLGYSRCLGNESPGPAVIGR